MVIQCCVCKRVRQGATQWEHQELTLAQLRCASHGYCPACAEAAFAEIRAWRRQRENEATLVRAVNL